MDTNNKKSKKILYGVLVVIAIIGGMALLNSLNTQREDALRQKEEFNTQQKQQERAKSALNDLDLIQKYKKYCTATVQRIDAANEFLRVVYMTQANAFAYYENEKRVYCPATITDKSSEQCKKIQSSDFETVFLCAKELPSSITDGTSGLQIKTQIAGTAVIVSQVVLDKPGFVVVYRLTAADKPQEILASSLLLQSGISEIVSIAIPQPMRVGLHYGATLYFDNGDGSFDAKTDTPVHNTDDTVLIAPFKTVKE